MRRGGNLGASRLKARRRALDPMRAYDALPPDLRGWMADAARPWSPTSCLRLWRKLLAEEGCPTRARDRLDRIEAATLARDAGSQGGFA
jgi:hypothetical protein